MKQSSVRARIRQICCLGIPGELLMASLLPLLRELVPSDSAAFFWVDSRGEMQNLYAERLLPAANPEDASELTALLVDLKLAVDRRSEDDIRPISVEVENIVFYLQDT